MFERVGVWERVELWAFYWCRASFLWKHSIWLRDDEDDEENELKVEIEEIEINKKTKRGSSFDVRLTTPHCVCQIPTSCAHSLAHTHPSLILTLDSSSL